MTKRTELVVLGSGPGGYTAAFRAADLGKKVVIIEQYPTLGGVCLNVGCIPSKTLLNMAHVIKEAAQAENSGIQFGEPVINLEKVRESKNKVIKQLTTGLNFLRQKRKVELVEGIASFKDANTLTITNTKGEMSLIQFEQAIIAAGSSPIVLPNLPQDPRIMTSTGALKLDDIPARFLIIGGGIIGLEMANIYHGLGSKVTIVELGNQIIPAADADIAKPLHKEVAAQCTILLKTKVSSVTAKKEGLEVYFEGETASKPEVYDRILCAVGRSPNSHNIGAENIGLAIEKGFIQVDNQMRTNLPHIFAIGDIVGQPMLAHKASAEAKVAAEAAAGHSHTFEPLCIPSVAYTDPELAWVGLTEKEAIAQSVPYAKGIFPWKASGRALTQHATEGITKLLFEPETRRIIGGAIVGAHASELIGEISLAIEMGCTAEDIELTIHPHPTLSETTAFAAEVFTGTITDL